MVSPTEPSSLSGVMGRRVLIIRFSSYVVNKAPGVLFSLNLDVALSKT